MKNLNEFVLLTLMFSILFFLILGEKEEENNFSNEYCGMWKIWHESDGEYGWPDQDNMYEKECME